MNLTRELSSKTNYTTFGGVIFPSDFCTDYEGTRNIAGRIMSDWKFDAQCKKNRENNKRMKPNKKGTN